MSTRSNVIIKDGYGDELFFYKHSDGYPEGNMPVLNKLLDWLKAGHIRDNVGQMAGWLIVLGAVEYNTIPKFDKEKSAYGSREYGITDSVAPPGDFKCGSYEPTTGIHGDINYLYEFDLKARKITIKEVYYKKDANGEYQQGFEVIEWHPKEPIN